MNLYIRFLFVMSFLGLGLAVAGVSVDVLQSKIVAQMKACDDLLAQKTAAQQELARRKNSGEPTSQVQLSVDRLSQLHVEAQKVAQNLRNEMEVLKSLPQI